MRAKDFTDETMHLMGYKNTSDLKWGDWARYIGQLLASGSKGQVGKIYDNGTVEFHNEQDGRIYTVPSDQLRRISNKK
jgi:hypothetical protein